MGGSCAALTAKLALCAFSQCRQTLLVLKVVVAGEIVRRATTRRPRSTIILSLEAVRSWLEWLAAGAPIAPRSTALGSDLARSLVFAGPSDASECAVICDVQALLDRPA